MAPDPRPATAIVIRARTPSPFDRPCARLRSGARAICATHCVDWPGCSRRTSGGVCSASGIAWLQPVHKWGMEIQRYEIREVTAPHSIREAMDMQVRARARLCVRNQCLRRR